MATKLPRAERSPHDDEREPPFTGPQPLRSGRPSSRPSAFGPPRLTSSLPPPAPDARGDGPPQTSELRLKRDPRGRDDDDDDLEATRPTLPRVPPRMRPSIPTDIEQLLPISQAVKSLPRPPRMPMHEASFESLPRRLPWASVGVFGCALLASAFSLLHYNAVPAPRASGPLAGVQATPLRPALALAEVEVEEMAPQSPVDPITLAGRFGAWWTLVGLAERARARGDRAAAERWAQRALATHPADPRPHRLYGELLADRGQEGAAGLAWSLARALERTEAPR